MSERTVRFAVVGFGSIGRTHFRTISGTAVPDGLVTALVTRQSDGLPDGIEVFRDVDTLLDAGVADVVVVATPTMDHEETSRKVLTTGCHLVVEKPMAMTVLGARRIIDARPSEAVAAVMLNQRYHGTYRRIREIVKGGLLGRIHRFSWIMTAWYRPNAYFAVSSWRGTWPGEGGGALLNQGIHNLDILQWILGLPASVYARAGFGKFHSIDVEDEVTALFEYDDGLSGVLVVSTGEAPGTNRFEIVGDRGTLVFEADTIRLAMTDRNVSEHRATSRDLFESPNFTEQREVPAATANQHAEVFNDVVGAVSEGRPVATPLEDGVASIELANAILVSAWEDRRVDLPVDAVAYHEALERRIEASDFREPEDLTVRADMERSYR